MHVLVNELSFIGQVDNDEDIPATLQILITAIQALTPLQNDDPLLTHSSLFKRNISPNYTIDAWARHRFPNDAKVNRDLRQYFIVLTRNHPFVDTVLDETLPYHDCQFNQQDVTGHSLAGAAYFKGTLVSLQNASDFASTELPVSFSLDGEAYKQIIVANITHANQLFTIRRRYNPTRKHASGGWGTLMDLDDTIAQEVLDKGIEDGKQVYGYHNGKFYTFQPDNAGGYHGYPVSEIEIPTRVMRQLRTK